MNKSVLKLSIAIATLAATPVIAQTQGAAAGAPAPAAPPCGLEDWIQQAKHPIDWFTWGGDVRLRNEYFNNALTLTSADKPSTAAHDEARHEQDYFRFRERLWTSIMPMTNFSANARLAAEELDWMKPSFRKQYGYRSGFEDRYGIVDNANVKWNSPFGAPLSITAGRQDIQLGDPLNWWLVADGTPYDGSWTTFLDSIRLTASADGIQTKFDVIYLYQNALPDDMIPTIGRSSANRPPGATKNSPYWLTEQNEQGVILYAYNKSIKNTEIDAYFIYKHDSQEESIRSPYNTPLGDNAEIYTVGGKVTGNPFEHWKYSAEGAYQFGHKQDPMVRTPVNVSTEDRPIGAFGVNANLNYLFLDQLKNQAGLVFEYLSGDDPKTPGKDEMFDVLWGRWPRWSELYIYSYPNETAGKFAQLNNIMRIGATWSLTPIKDTTLSATYNALFAPEEVPTRTLNAALFSEKGNFRGHFLQTVLKHQFNKHVSGHLWAEFIWQGDYYAQRDLMTFLRAEMLFTF